MRTKCEIQVAGEVPGTYTNVGEQVDLGEPGPAEFARSLSAHSFGMDYVARHVSFTKGCFTGQELVGRLDSRGGNVPFRLARVRGADVNEMHDVVLSAGPSGDRAQQGLTTLVGAGPFSALALVHRTLLGDARAATIGGVHIELLHDGGTSGR
jgi:folate-binding protein YgfZ